MSRNSFVTFCLGGAGLGKHACLSVSRDFCDRRGGKATREYCGSLNSMRALATGNLTSPITRFRGRISRLGTRGGRTNIQGVSSASPVLCLKCFPLGTLLRGLGVGG